MNLLLAAARVRQGNGIIDIPGPAALLHGNTEWGYYGEVPNLVSQSVLASNVGLTIGTVLNEHPGWLKFSAKGKTLFVAKKPLRSGVSWYDLYAKGAVFGDDGMGSSPPVTKPMALQNKRIVIGGLTYRVRLLRGFDVSVPDRSQGTFDSTTVSGEFARLILPVLAGVQNGQVSADWAAFSYADLGMVDNGARTLIQEAARSTDSTGENFRWYMGRSLDYNYVFNAFFNGREHVYGWRPVLELDD